MIMNPGVTRIANESRDGDFLYLEELEGDSKDNGDYCDNGDNDCDE